MYAPSTPRWLLALTLSAPVALAKGGTTDTGNETCTYAGVKLDLAAMPNTPGRTNSVPDDFSGLVVCTDPQTRRVYETYTLTKGKRTGETRRFDRSTGNLEELVPYRDGRREGCVQRYQPRTRHLVFEFCVHDDEPQGLQKRFDADTGALVSIQWVLPRGTQGEATSIQFNKQGQPTSLQCGPQTLVGADDLWCGRGGREGEVTLYASEGWPTETASYRDGQRHGWTRRWRRDGTLTSERRYEKGEEVEARQVDAAGGRKYERTSADGQDTETVYFEASKAPRLQLVRAKGQLTKETAWYANGKVHYEKVARDGRYEVKRYDDAGRVVEEGTFFPRWGDGVGLWGLAPAGAVRRSVEGVLVEEANYADGRRDGLQRFYDGQAAGRLVRREHYVKGALRWSEDVTAGRREVLRRDYAEDGSVQSEVLVRAPQQL